MVKGLNHKLFQEAKKYMAGGVNSPVRAFRAVGGEPIFIKLGRGSKIYSEDGREFIDYCQGYGALILGHAHPAVVRALKKTIGGGTAFGSPTKDETELARLISGAMPAIEVLRLTNSGTEAVMGAVRLARAFTKKDKVIKFEGSYHGHADYLLNCAGVPEDFKKNTLELPYNDIEKVEEAARRDKGNIAAIIVEPVAGNMGVVLPRGGFLEALRKVADRYNIVLIFDEVITGFRLSFGGAQKLFGIEPDLVCLGKIIGGGLPVGAFGGRRKIMKLLAPEGSVYQAGTFSGNPITVQGGITTLELLKELKPYEDLKKSTNRLCEEMRSRARTYKIKLKVNNIASMFGIFFTDKDAAKFKRFYHGLVEEGVYLSPSSLETFFLSTAHTARDLDKTVKAVDKVFRTFLKER